MEWIWLLHDDCEPAPDALEQMLRAASRNRSTAVLGPKLKDLADRQVLREAGVTVDRAGRRCTGIEPGEIDQGQHDGNRPVLAVSSAGMLIRRDVWDQVGGFDPNLPLMRDDLDFCWRVHAAGYDIRVITDAVVYHRDLSARQIRKAPAAGGHPRMADRRGALYVFAANVPFGPMLASWAAAWPAHCCGRPISSSPSSSARPGITSARSPGCCVTRSCSGEPAAAAPPTAGTRGRSCAVSCRGAGRWPGSPNRPRACWPAVRPTTAAGCITPSSTKSATTCRCLPPIRWSGGC